MKTCAACGETQNPDQARFCMACTVPLDTVPVADRRERRVVSALFADLVGFTSRSEALDVEDVQTLLGGYHQLLRRELERHGGTVEKFIGDAVMALFGAPVSHEDDAERAVRAALAIQDSVALVRDRDGVDLHVRVGVTTGEALVALGANPGAGEGMASGDVVNTAARLQSAAPADGVLVDERTYRATDRVLRYAPADPVVAKGKAQPVAAWRALAPRSAVPEQARESLPLVGREVEVGLLVGAFERARRDPSTQLVSVIGAPGIGKSRLVEELGAHVERRPELVTWRRGRSLAYGEGVSLWALGEMVKDQAGVLESDTSQAAADKLAEAVAALLEDDQDRRWVARHLGPLIGLEAGRSVSEDGAAVEAVAAWRRFFEALAEAGPTVLVFEDVHWADDRLLDFIDLLAERGGAIPLLIVCTARPELLDRRPGWGGGKPNALTIQLTPLSSDDTARLVGDLLEQALLPADTQRALLDRAGGNPLYAQEYVRMLRDQGALVQEAGGWRLVGEPQGLPESVQAIIAARLDTLDDEERRLLQNAAVIGRTGWLGAAAEVGERPRLELEEVLHRLERKQLVQRQRRSSVAGDIEFSFAHALTLDVAYGQIRRPERADKHERAAGWIARLTGQRDDKAELLAHHLSSALELRRQAGEPVEQLALTARDALADAGRQAFHVYAFDASLRHLQSALDLTPEGDPARPRLLFDLAMAGVRAGHPDAQVLDRAIEMQLAAGQWEAAGELLYRRGLLIFIYDGEAEPAHAMMDQALEYATRDGYTRTASRVVADRALDLYVAGRSQEALELTEGAIRRAELAQDGLGRATLLTWHGSVLAAGGDRRGLEEMWEGADTLASEADVGTLMAYLNLAEQLVGVGDLEPAAQARVQLARWAKRFGTHEGMQFSHLADSDTAFHTGEWDRALELTEPIVGIENQQLSTWASLSRSRILVARGQLTPVLESAESMLGYSQRTENVEALVEGLIMVALANHLAGRHGEAERRCRQVFSHLEESGVMLGDAPVVDQLALLGADGEQLRSAIEMLPDLCRWKSSLLAICDRRFDDAVRNAREIGSRPSEACAHLLAARHFAAAGDGRAAAGHAEQALRFYRAVGAAAYGGLAEQAMRDSA